MSSKVSRVVPDQIVIDTFHKTTYGGKRYGRDKVATTPCLLKHFCSNLPFVTGTAEVDIESEEILGEVSASLIRIGKRGLLNVKGGKGPSKEHKLQKTREELWYPIEYLPLKELLVDAVYQRFILESQVRRIVRNFDPALFGTLSVGRRADGSNWVYDGLQRLTAIRELGLPVCPCQVSPSSGQVEEAGWFSSLNTDRSRVDALSLFKALKVQGLPAAIRIDLEAGEAGFIIPERKQAHWPNINAIATLRKAFARPNIGGEGLRDGLQMLQSSVGQKHGRDLFVQTGFLDGYFAFLSKFVWRRTRVEQVLKKVTEEDILGSKILSKAARRLTGGGRGAITELALQSLYKSVKYPLEER